MDLRVDIVKYINERVKPIDFKKILIREADDGPDGPDDGGFDDGPGGGDDDLGGFDDGPSHGPMHGPTSHHGIDNEEPAEAENPDEKEDKAQKFMDREDDPDFENGVHSDEVSAAEVKPSGTVVYDVKSVLQGLNSAIQSSELDLTEVDAAKNVLELVSNGKKLIDKDFEDIHNYQSFSDIINRAIESTDEKTKNYFSIKIKEALLAIQNQKKIDMNKAKGNVEQLRDVVDKF